MLNAVLVEERLADNAAAMGELLRSELRAIKNPAILDVRGKGLLNALQIKPQAGKDGTRRLPVQFWWLTICF